MDVEKKGILCGKCGHLCLYDSGRFKITGDEIPCCACYASMPGVGYPEQNWCKECKWRKRNP
jgi:hypothetical protein